MSDELTPLRRAQHMHDKLREIDSGIHSLLGDLDAERLDAEALNQLKRAAELVHEAQKALHHATALTWR